MVLQANGRLAVQIRPARAGEVLGLVELINAAYRAAEATLWVNGPAFSRTGLEEVGALVAAGQLLAAVAPVARRGRRHGGVGLGAYTLVGCVSCAPCLGALPAGLVQPLDRSRCVSASHRVGPNRAARSGV
jgi:hypothetical protein